MEHVAATLSTLIIDATATGKALVVATDAAAARTAIGAGTSSFNGAFSSLTGVPTTVSGYGITNALVTTNNLSDLTSASTARTNLGLGSLATQSGTFSGTSSGTNTGDQSTFGTIAVSGQSNVVADQTNDTLTLVAGTNVTITTDATTDTITITAAGATPAGSSGQVQYNNAGSFGGTAALVYATTGTHVAVTAQSSTVVPICAKGATSQSADLQQWQDSSGTSLASITAAGALKLSSASPTLTASSVAFISSAGLETQNSGKRSTYINWDALTVRSDAFLGFASGTTVSQAQGDTCFCRNAAGVIEINSGTAGTFRDLIVRNLRMSAPTLVPASASATGSEGQIAWDANYIYICTATNTWKRVAIATW